MPVYGRVNYNFGVLFDAKEYADEVNDSYKILGAHLKLINILGLKSINEYNEKIFQRYLNLEKKIEVETNDMFNFEDKTFKKI